MNQKLSRATRILIQCSILIYILEVTAALCEKGVGNSRLPRSLRDVSHTVLKHIALLKIPKSHRLLLESKLRSELPHVSEPFIGKRELRKYLEISWDHVKRAPSSYGYTVKSGDATRRRLRAGSLKRFDDGRYDFTTVPGEISESLAGNRRNARGPVKATRQRDRTAKGLGKKDSNDSGTGLIYEKDVGEPFPPGEIERHKRWWEREALPKRDIKRWLDEYGVPKSMPPAAWCSSVGMTIAVPENVTSFMLDKRAGKVVAARWGTEEAGCRVDIVSRFFKGTSNDKIGAWVGHAPYNSCGGNRIESDTHIYYINTLFAPYSTRNVIGICGCPKDLTNRTQSNSGKAAEPRQCFPTAQWEEQTKARSVGFIINQTRTSSEEELLPAVGQSLSGGYMLSSLATAGKANEIVIKNADSSIIFESYMQKSNGYIWPLDCKVFNQADESGTEVYPLIVGGCPVSHKLNFTVHSPIFRRTKGNPLGLVPGRITFSILPITFANGILESQESERFQSKKAASSESFLKFKCQMGVFPTPVTEEDFCFQRSDLFFNPQGAHFSWNATDATAPSPHSTRTQARDNSTLYGPTEVVHQNKLKSQLNQEIDRVLQQGINATASTRRLQLELTAVQKMKPEFIRDVSGPMQISSWKNYRGENYLVQHRTKRDAAFLKHNQLMKEEQQASRAQKEDAEKLLQSQLEARENLLHSVIMNEQKDFMESNPLSYISKTAPPEIPTEFPTLWISPELRDEVPVMTDDQAAAVAELLRATPGYEETVEGETLKRYVPSSSEVFDTIDNSVVYGPWAINWNRIGSQDFQRVSVGSSRGAIGVGGSVPLRSETTSVNWGPNAISVSSNPSTETASVAVLRGKHGINVERSNLLQATSIETVSRFVETATLIDQLNSIFGERVRVRNFDLAFRRDFQPETPAMNTIEYNPLTQEIALNYRSVSVIVGSNKVDNQYLASVGLRGYQVTTIADFDEYLIDFQANWGNGWQAVVQADYIDPLDDQIFTAIEFGKLGRAYAGASVGIGSDGIPQGSATFQTADLGFAVEFFDSSGTRLLNYALTVGKFTFTWESSVVLENLLVPALIFPGLTAATVL